MIGYVYVMSAGRGPKKIGVTTDLVRREAQLPCRLSLEEEACRLKRPQSAGR